ncbi:DUF7424 family protein [Phytobacter sp. V91]|uniref:DUF7424 family protein n=1 Tax=Phytobacter sp. V91 TaxID=3369425 RepID=UPI003F610DAB
MKRKILLIAMITILVGCKFGVRTTIPLSGLLSEGIKEINSDLFVEVASCTDFEDSRKPSQTLTDAQKTVASTLPEAKFKECFTQKMVSWASFTLPIVYGRYPGERLKDDGRLHILSYPDKEGQYIAIEAAESLKKRVNEHNSKGYSDFDPSNLLIYVTIDNDTKIDKKMDIVSSFVQEKPAMLISNTTLAANQYIEIRLSDVATQAVLLPESLNQQAIFMRNIH